MPSTTDVEAVKRAYRALIKRYHPDTVTSRSPETVRRYTIKCGRINQAFRQAIEQCVTGEQAVGTGPLGEKATARKPWKQAARWSGVWRRPEHPPTERPRGAAVRNEGPVNMAVTYLAPLLVVGSPILVLCLVNMLRQMAYLLGR